MKKNFIWFCLGLLITSAFAFIPRRARDYSLSSEIEKEFNNFSLLSLRVPVLTDRIPTINDLFDPGSLWLDTLTRSLYLRSETTDNGWYQITSGTQPEIPAQNRPENRFRYLNSIVSVFVTSYTTVSGSARPIPFPNELIDTDSMHSTTSNNGRLESAAPANSGLSGKYLITGYAFIANFPANDIFAIAISTNQCTTLKSITKVLSPGSIADLGLSISAIRNLGQNDYVELCYIAPASQTLEAEFSMTYIGE